MAGTFLLENMLEKLIEQPAFVDEVAREEEGEDDGVPMDSLCFAAAVNKLLEEGVRLGVVAVYERMEAVAKAVSRGDVAVADRLYTNTGFVLMCRAMFERKMDIFDFPLLGRAAVAAWLKQVAPPSSTSILESADLDEDFRAALEGVAARAAYLGAWSEVANSKFMVCVPGVTISPDGAAGRGACRSGLVPLPVKYEKSRHQLCGYTFPTSRFLRSGKVPAVPIGLIVRPRALGIPIPVDGASQAAASGGGAAGGAAASATAVTGGGASSALGSVVMPPVPRSSEVLRHRPVVILRAEEAVFSHKPETLVQIVPGKKD